MTEIEETQRAEKKSGRDRENEDWGNTRGEREVVETEPQQLQG